MSLRQKFKTLWMRMFPKEGDMYSANHQWMIFWKGKWRKLRPAD